jgi:hypothetical protein
MASLIKDSGGQWIVLAGLAVSLSLVLIATLVTQASINGYYSSDAPLEFPKEQVRELTAQSRESSISSAQLAWKLNNSSNPNVFTNFKSLFDNYSSQVSVLYAAHGDTVNITLFNYTQNIDNYTYTSEKVNTTLFNSNHLLENIWLNITYYNGDTEYYSSPEIIWVKT